MKKNFGFIFFISVVIIFVLSCEKSENEAEVRNLILSGSEQQKAEADNEFTFKLFKEALSEQPVGKNIMLSPLSVSMAVGMTSNGSNGQTSDAIRTAMEFNNFTEEQINSYYHKLITELPELDPKAILKIANSIWYRNGFVPLPAFLQANKVSYNATVEGLDFSNPASVDKINNWVNSKTLGKIPSIIEEIPANSVMYLINAVYFKSNWTYKFDKSKTAKGGFYVNDNNMVQADFMTASVTMNTFTDQDIRFYELPYGNKKYSMVIAMPTGNASISQFAAGINGAKWKDWMGNLTEMTSEIKMPKFKFSYNIKLNSSLVNLGMGPAFSIGADFTRMNAAGNLKIDEVKHKTFIEVNEEGTEAAAATSVGMMYTSVPAPVVINRPFLFAIREMNTGLILFTGIVNNPLLPD